jgi:hypothetical protein
MTNFEIIPLEILLIIIGGWRKACIEANEVVEEGK